ncbi:CapA family protein [Thermomonospora umbrina]|uniref:Poly-gamma-glutamate synthesis protein (Capsule biosynthesis protein) n=1 Tax=Thermomonospora umbrina TaxID=111806 RepID=A0A3D9SYB2_9ACTN|nr:CapA family protein [Thermomonospora umbrina]REE97554.1 poly-gamma-glutamate synthesis protein (capsule biosynthesis protein) [Thermomonospora umbrina]
MGRRLRAATIGAAVTAAMTFAAGCGPLESVLGEDGGPGGRKDGPRQPLTVAFGGDVHFEGRLRTRLDTAPDTALGPIARTLSAADLSMINLETAITAGGAPAPKQFVFRAPPTAFRALRGAGVDVVTMANNHGMDYGETGLRDSIAAGRQAGFPIVGIGNNAAEAYRPWTTTVKGNRVAVIGATQVLDDNLIQAWTATDAKAGLASAKDAPRLVRAVQEARKDADIVIVNLHWGQELNTCATDVQKQLADQLVTAGADAVVGSHAHVLQAGGYLKGKYVHYGLGNFVFYNSSARTAPTGVLTLTFKAGGGAKGAEVSRADWTPALITDGIPQPLTGAAAQQARTAWEGLRSCSNVTARPA